MSEKDVVENVDSPGEIGIPIANNSTPGIASFDSNDFTVGPDGKVSSIVERGIPQYLGKITGTGTGTTDLNWEVDWKSRPTVIANGEEEVDKAKRIKIGEYIMLTAHFNQFVPGDIFRITSVQIEGSTYIVKTNNVRALSLASIVGPQGKQGNEGPQGVPYLAYTNSIESTVDPVIDSIMHLEDGHFNRTPIINPGEYQDVVTVDWYNKTTHKAFMVTGIIQGRDSSIINNPWVAQITAATDITGAVGPQGKEGAGIADIVDIDYPHGDFIDVQYDTTDGIRMQGIAYYLRDDGEIYQIPTDIDIPLVAGPGLSMDKKNTEKKVEIKSLNSNLENGEGLGSVKMSKSSSSSKGAFAFASGYYTNADGSSTYAGGYCAATTTEYSISYGISTMTQNGVLAAFGKYNNPTTGDIFEVGNGSGSSRKNAFAVLADGRAKVQAAPKDNNDVPRLAELNNKVSISENFVKVFTIPNGASTGTLTADVKQKLCNPDGHNYYVFDDTSQLILKYSFNADDEIIQYKAIYLQTDKAYEITMQILPSNGSWRRSQTVLNAGDSSVQPDYNQNDSTAKDYIKNRPFYEGPVAVFDKNITTTPYPDDATLYEWEIVNEIVNAKAGDEIRIVFNGENYPQTVKELNNILCVGNASFLGAGEDTKEPFFIALMNAMAASDAQGELVKGLSIFTKTTYNGEVKIIANGVKTLDPKFLPSGSGGEAVTPSTATTTATSGTFTSAEWAKLQANDNNYILFNNEIYRLADKAHSGTTGIWSYTHTGWDGTAIMDKSINVTVSTGAWTLVVGSASAGGKSYLHSLYFPGTTNKPLLTFYHTSPTKVTDEWIYEHLTNNTYCLTFYPTITSISQYGSVGLSVQLVQTSSSPSWGANIDLGSPSATSLSVSQAAQYIVTEV